MHQLTRRAWVAAVLAATLPLQAAAQSGAGKTATLVVPFAAGGPSDFIARLLARPLGREMGAQVIIDNRPGASGNIGAKQVMASKPDGLTLVHTTIAMQAVNPLMYPDQDFNPSRDLVPVGITGALPNVLVVHPSSGIKTIAELVAKGRQKNVQLNFATFGPGSSPHFYGMLFEKTTQVAAEPIAYKGSGDAAKDMLAGRIDFMFDSMTTAIANVKAGKLVALAITSPQRSALLPDVPTFKELGIDGLEFHTFLGFFGPKNLPKEMAQEFNAALRKVLAEPAVLDKLGSMSLQPAPTTLAEARAEVAEMERFWKKALQK